MSRAGLAAERTALAWRRTAVAAMLTGALFLNHAVSSGWRPALIAPIVAAVAMAALAVMGYLRNRDLHKGRYGFGGRSVAAATAVVVIVAVIAAVIQFTAPLPETLGG
ncbi:uncharacterized protein DUF202 [Nocardia tenerifensis]|uniref:Uncharacterized protein DUF202 n=1 Tax=Nocardia tenerifensis TaxID=228006 RepID=A0A318JZ54_9NOCA|nr:DUF202 domain-containing protein [Nocardia tenerifensis]PXX64022.1 uncharacterized protein DUF202 [Nocardia tenerifensis]